MCFNIIKHYSCLFICIEILLDSLNNIEMGGTKMRKKNHTKKNVHNSKKKVTSSNTNNQTTEVAVYDELFAKQQVARHFGTCVVCHKHDYFLKSCSRCKDAKCCFKCLGDHGIKVDQRLVCIRNVLFANARKCIPLALKENYFNEGFAEISSHLYSVPKREVFDLMGRSRSVLLVQVLAFNIIPWQQSNQPPTKIVQLIVQDNDGLKAAIHIFPNPFFVLFHGLDAWLLDMGAQLPIRTFILLTGICWNYRVNGASIDVVNHVQQMQVIGETAKIYESVTSKDNEVINQVFE
ncbi:hypothetical protein Bpfe_004007, partial [Biomphalaria pfeifferi]